MLPYDEAGTGSPLVLLHAGIADRSMWAEQLAPLAAAGFHVIAPDLPGFGEAPEGPGALAPWQDVLELLDGLGVGAAALAGDSFGAAVALRVAVVAPERVRALALLSMPAAEVEQSERLKAVWAAEEAAVERGDVEAAVRAVVDGWTLPDAPPQLRERVATMQRRALELQLAAGDVEEAPDPVDADPDWPARLRMPVLLAAGERDMPDMQEAVHVLKGRLPHARAEFIAGAGHLAPLETPEAFQALLLDFLAGTGDRE
jgi:pimeloyl-ACP methyl ester carboxylesterase